MRLFHSPMHLFFSISRELRDIDMAIPFTIHRLVIKKDAGYGFDSAIVAASSSYAADTTSAFGTRFWNKNLSISIDHLHLHTRRPSLNLPHSSTISVSPSWV
ncbi:hypothetical protein Dimus_037662 [Dionaea muscipula]